ncbi:MAG TPA: TonB-dependent receptor [Candidatus Acidoferrales bacterium]|nr:TonB-dependent receptor [Candidatus Acidoferrales bacterium]
MLHRILKLGLPFAIIVFAFASISYSQSRSKIQGTVKDAKTGETLPGVNVFVVGTSLGATSDINGKYFIVNVPAGTYDLRASMIGYTPVVVKGVVVAIERVATEDFALESAEIKTGEVVITAERNELHKEVSGTQMVVTNAEILNTSGIREINQFLEKLPGISVDVNGYLTIRGGTADEVGTMVNGLAYDNPAVGNSETNLPLSSIDQVSVLSGGYNAEYGNFRSGLVNFTTKTGTASAYHGTLTVSRDQSHMRRFGNSLYDPHNSILGPYLDPSVAFHPDTTSQLLFVPGWDSAASAYNKGKPLSQQVTPLEMYMLMAWMTTTVPDYNGLNKQMQSDPTILGNMTITQAETLLTSTRSAFLNHANKEGGSDYNLDGGFGGPVPLIGKALGDATFYISNNTKNTNYMEPVTLDNDFTSVTMLSVKAMPSAAMSLTLNGLWKREIGVSPIRPPNGDLPDVSNRGGFMQQDNLQWIYSNTSIIGDGYNYLYDQAYFPILDQTTLVTGLTFNHLLSPTTFYEITLNRSEISDNSPTGDNRNTSLITEIGPFNLDESPYGKLQFAPNHRVYSPTDTFTFASYDDPPSTPWVSLFRFRSKEGDLHDNSKSYSYTAKGDFSSQIGEHNFVKGGIEYNEFDLNHNFYETWNNNAYNTYEFNYHEKPSQTGLYLQDQINYEGIVANLGIRFDYYYGGGGLWPSSDSAFAYSTIFLPQDTTGLYQYLATGQSQIWHKWDSLNAVEPGFLQPIQNFYAISPRVGLSFPITENSKFYFNYGHFRSSPPYYSMYDFQYRYTKQGLYMMSNPNMEPPRTIQYETGVEYNPIGGVMLRVSGYYKDVTGKPGRVTYNAASNGVTYNSYLGNEYQNIQGVEVELSKRDNSWINGWINFNYEFRKTGLTGYQKINEIPDTTGASLYIGNEQPTFAAPQLNGDLILRSPQNWGPQPAGLDLLGNWALTIFGTWKNGEYFPLFTGTVSDPQLRNIYLQWPGFFRIDARLEKQFKIAGLAASFFVDVTNVFNTKISLLGEETALYNQQAYGGTGAISNSTPPYAFLSATDETEYLATLRLPIYNSSLFDNLRLENPGWYIPGNDKVGDLNSPSKPYIHNPAFADLFMYGQPRDIWFGVKIDF